MRSIIFAALFWSSLGVSQDLPDSALLPWTILGLPNEAQVEHERWLNEHWQKLADRMLRQPESYKVYAGPASRNAARMARRILVGAPTDELWQKRAVMPVLCGLEGRLDVFLVLANLADDQMVGIAQLNLAQGQILEGGLPAMSLEDLFGQLAASATQAPLPYRQSALQLDVRSAKPWTRADRGDHRCLDLRLAHRTYQMWPTVTLIGREDLGHIRRMIRFRPDKILRPSRVVRTEWRPEPGQAYVMKATLSESVFGQRLSTPELPARTTNIGADGWLEGQAVEPLLAQLQEQMGGLQLDQLPQVAKVYGAWVYLDKGRAYGLKMNDRLVVAGRESDIKGHVVGFYGPGLGLISPQGYPIQEGAIVYIRLGQRQTRRGQALAYDTRQYPTDWPPTSK